MPTTPSPVITGLQAPTDTGTSLTDRITSHAAPVLKGTTVAGASVRVVEVVGGVEVPVDGNFVLSGTSWTYELADGFRGEGAHVYRAYATLAGDTESLASVTSTVVIDRTGPAILTPVFVTVETDSGVRGDWITEVVRPEFEGKVEPRGRVTVFIDNEPFTTYVANSAGGWHTAPNFNVPFGTHDVHYEVRDAAGNVTVSPTVQLVVNPNITPANAPVIGNLTTGTDTGASNTDRITNDDTPSISGTAEPGSLVRVYNANDLNQIVGTATANALGAWTAAITVAQPAGDQNFIATADDRVNGPSVVSAARKVTFDYTTTAVTGLGIKASSDTGADDFATEVTRPTLEGIAEVGSTVTVTLGAQSISVTAAASGAWSTPIPAALAPSATPYAFTVKVTDVAGNTSTTSGNLTILEDVTAPAKPTIATSLVAGSDTGKSTSDKLTSLSNPKISGSAEPGATIHVYDNGTPVGTTAATASGAWTYQFEGLTGDPCITSHPITVRAGEPGLLSATSTAFTFTVDTAAPDAPTLALMTTASDSGVKGDWTTSNQRPTVTGYGAEPSAQVRIYDGETALGTTNAAADGTWSYTLPTRVEGNHPITARGLDIAGNLSAPTPVKNLVIDRTAEAPTGQLADSLQKDPTGETTHTNAERPVLTGTAEARATVQLFEGTTALGITIADAAGNWTFRAPVADDGDHTYSAIVLDRASNKSAKTTLVTVTVDTDAPTDTPTVFTDDDGDAAVLSATDGLVFGHAPLIFGELPAYDPDGDFAGIAIYNNGVLLGTTVPYANEAETGWEWSFALPQAAEGCELALSIDVHLIDRAGNLGPAQHRNLTSDMRGPDPVGEIETTGELRGDNDMPHETSGLTHLTNTVAPTLVGTAPDGAAWIDLRTPDGEAVGSTSVSGATWSLAMGTTALNTLDGEVGYQDFDLIAYDAYGNASAPTRIRLDADLQAPEEAEIYGFDVAANLTPRITLGGPLGEVLEDEFGSLPSTSVTAEDYATLRGTAEPGAFVRLELPDGTPLGLTNASAGGSWSYVFEAGELGPGTNTIKAFSIDAVGNMGSAASFDYLVDDEAPTGFEAILYGDPNEGDAVLAVSTSEYLSFDVVASSLADDVALIAMRVDGQVVDYIDPFEGQVGGEGVFEMAYRAGSGLGPVGGLAEGAHQVDFALIDQAGNEHTTPAMTVMVDTIAPTAPIVTHVGGIPGLGEQLLSSSALPSFQGVAEPDSWVYLTDGETTLAGTRASGSGGWFFGLTTSLLAGDNHLTLVATDRAGHEGATEIVVHVDQIDPATPSLNHAQGDVEADPGVIRTAVTTPLLRGTGEAGTTLSLYLFGDDPSPSTTLLVDDDGNWSFAVPGSWSLTEGISYTLELTAVDAAGRQSDAASYALEVDTSAIDAASALSLDAATDSGVQGDRLTNTEVTGFEGVGEAADATVMLMIDGEIAEVDSTDASGNWAITLGTSLADGTYNAQVVIVDDTGNIGAPSPAFEFYVDRVAPPAMTNLDMQTDTGLSGTDFNTNFTAPSFNSTYDFVEDVVAVKISRDGVPLGQTSAGPTSWYYHSETLAPGEYTFAFTLVDAAGNEGPTRTQTVTIDTTTPTPTITGISPDSGAAFDASTASDGRTNEASVTLAGTAEASSVVQLIFNGSPILTTNANTAGSFAFGNVDLASLGQGTLTAHATDVAGNSAMSTGFGFWYDNTAGSASIDAISSDTANTYEGGSATDFVTRDATLTFLGSAESGALVELFAGGVSYGTAIAATGSWILTVPSSLADGTYDFVAAVTDRAGNYTTSSVRQVIVDNQAPDTDLALNDDTGSSASDFVTNAASPALTGEADGPLRATVTVAGVGTTSVTMTAAGTWTVPLGWLSSDEDHELSVRIEDRAGSASMTSVIYHHDTTTSAPTFSSYTEDLGLDSNDGITADDTVTLAGYAEPLSVVHVLVDGVELSQTALTGANGEWTLALGTLPASGGAYGIDAYTVDRAGNVSDQTQMPALTVDTSIDPFAVFGIGPDTGVSDADGITSQTAVTLSGEAEAGTRVRVTVNGALSTAFADGDGDWSIGVDLSANTSTYIAITAMDVAGNVIATSYIARHDDSVAGIAASAPAFAFGVDNGASTSDGIAYAEDGEFSFTGSVTDAAQVRIYVDHVYVQTVDVDAEPGDAADGQLGTYAWSLEDLDVAPGTHAIHVQPVDLAGNLGASSTAYDFNVLPNLAAPQVRLDAIYDPNQDGYTSIAGATIRILVDPATESLEVYGPGDALLATTDLGQTVDGLKVYAATLAADLTEGANTFTVYTSESEYGRERSASTVLTLDTVAPDAPSINDITPESPVTPWEATSASPMLIGTASEGNATVTVFQGGVAIGSTSTLDMGNGQFGWQIPLTTSLVDGTHTLTARVTDRVGFQGPADSQVITVDTAGDFVPTIVRTGDDGGTSPTDGIGQSRTLDMSTIGGALNGATGVEITIAGPQGTTTLPATIAGSDWYPAGDYAMTAEGTYTMTVAGIDQDGNLASTSTTLVVDNTGSGTVTMLPTVNAGGNGLTNDETPTFSGTAEPGSTVDAYIYGAESAYASTTADANGLWSFTPNMSTFPDGSYTIGATIWDLAGNSAGPSRTIVLDTAAEQPIITGIADDTEGGPVGTSNDFITSDTTLTVEGMAEDGATVTLVVNGLAKPPVTLPFGTTGFALDAGTLGEGTHSVLVTTTDRAGNTNASVAQQIVVDTTIDTVSNVVLMTSTDSGVSMVDGVTNHDTPTLGGKTKPYSYVELTPRWDDTDHPEASDGAFADENGNWAITMSSSVFAALTEDVSFKASVVDRAGNETETPLLVSGLLVTLDNDAPAATASVTGLNQDPTSDSGLYQDDNVTRVPKPVIEGTVAGTGASHVAVYGALDGGAETLLGTAPVSGGAWSFTPGSNLAEGDWVFTAVPRDDAGNQGAFGADAPVVIDVTRPLIADLTFAPVFQSGSFNYTRHRDFDFAGTVSNPGTVTTVHVERTRVATGAKTTFQVEVGPDGSFNEEYTLPTTQGEYRFKLTLEDQAGNLSLTSYTTSIFYDITAPGMPDITTSPYTDTDGLVTIGGAANSAAPYATVYVTADGPGALGSTVAAADGSWSFTNTTPLTAALNYVFRATQTDAAGNVGSGEDSVVITVDPPLSLVSPAGGLYRTTLAADSVSPQGYGLQPNEAFTIVIDGSATVWTGNADSLGQWTAFVTASDTNGSGTEHTFTVYDSGSGSTSFTFLLDDALITGDLQVTPVGGAASIDDASLSPQFRSATDPGLVYFTLESAPTHGFLYLDNNTNGLFDAGDDVNPTGNVSYFYVSYDGLRYQSTDGQADSFTISILGGGQRSPVETFTIDAAPAGYAVGDAPSVAAEVPDGTDWCAIALDYDAFGAAAGGYEGPGAQPVVADALLGGDALAGQLDLDALIGAPLVLGRMPGERLEEVYGPQAADILSDGDALRRMLEQQQLMAGMGTF